MRALPFVTLLAVGCDGVFGGDFPQSIVVDAAVDASGPVRVAGTWSRRYIRDTRNNGPLAVPAPFAEGEVELELWIEGERRDLDWNYANGNFFFDALGGQHYRVVKRVTPQLEEVQSRLPAIAIVQTAYVRPGATPVDPAMPPTLSGTLVDSEAAPLTVLATTGASWQELAITPHATTGVYPAVEWQGDYLGNSGAGDRMFFAQFDQYAGYRAIARFDRVSEFMIGPGSNAANGTLVDAVPSWCADLAAPTRALDSTLERLYPDFARVELPGWIVAALPLAYAGTSAQFRLAEQTDPGLHAVAVRYNDPYGDFDHLAISRSFRVRALRNGELTVASVVNAIEHARIERAQCPTSATPSFHTEPPPIASNPRIGTTFVTTDGAKVPLGGAATVRMAWDGERADLYTVVLFDVTGRSELSDVSAIIRSTEPYAELDARALLVGHSYLAWIYAERGFEGAARGDFTRLAYPYTLTTGSTAVFTITP